MRLITALLAATLPVLANGQAQLLPTGEFKARDGRPGPGKSWKLNDAAGQALAAQVNAVAAQTPVVIDYEHQTLKMEKNGQPAPAAGWIHSVTWLDGKGLFSELEWTEKARASIAANEYRYISPVITFDEDTGAVQGLHLAALTNFPALLGMDAVVAALNTQLPTQEPRMATLLAALIASLGLPSTTTEAECTAAVAALKTQADAAKVKTPLSAALTTALGISATADETAALSAITALKAPAAGGDTVQLVAQLTGQVASLRAQLDGDKVTAAVDAAIAGKKLVPAQRDTYIELGKKDVAMLTAVLAAAPVIPGLDGQASHLQGDGGSTGTAALTATQSLIAKQLGLDPAKYAESLKAQA